MSRFDLTKSIPILILSDGPDQEVWAVCRNENYHISSLGRLRRRTSARGAVVGKILKFRPDKDGYLRFKVYSPWSRYVLRIHREVAHAFLGPCPEGKEVNHQDGDKTNNRVTNLEYVTQQENLAHATRNGLKAKGEQNGYSKYTEKEIRIMKSMAMTMRPSEVADCLGLPRTTVWGVVSGKAWKHVAI
mgnify:CR=1 FL=1